MYKAFLKKRIKNILKYLVVFAITLTISVGILAISALIPNSAIQNNMKNSALSYKNAEAFSFDQVARLTSVSDNYADTILLNISYNMGKYGPLDTKYYDGEALGEHIGFYLTVKEENIKPNTDYTRYWHGSSAFIRFLHLFTDVKGIKIIGLVFTFLLLCVVCTILICKGHLKLAIALMLSAVCVHIWNTSLSLEYQPAFIVGFLMCILYLLFEARGDKYLKLLSVCGGVLVAFFDFLTVETVSVLLPMLIVFAVREREGRLGEFKVNFRLSIKCGVLWLFAYVTTFVSKWAIASLATGENKFISAFSSVGERIAGSVAKQGVSNPILRTIFAPLANLTVLFGGGSRVEPLRVFVAFLIVAVLVISILYLFYKKRSKAYVKLSLVLSAVLLARFLILSNHSFLHEFFTYRALITPVFALFSALFIYTEKEVGKG